MLVDLIKRMVITEKYIYLDPKEQEQFEMRLQKFKDAQAKREQEEEEKEEQKEEQKEKEEEKEEQKQKGNDDNEEVKETSANDKIKDNDITENNKSKLTSNSMNVEEKNQFKKTNNKKIEYPTYAFDLDVRLTKPQIKVLLEKVFNVDIVSLNTYIAPMKKKRVGFNQGYKGRYKRAIIKLKPNQKINNPLDKEVVSKI